MAPLLKKSKRKVSLQVLRENFPQLLPTINWAKGRYRSLCVLKPYINVGGDKVLLAERAYMFGLSKHTVPAGTYPKGPTRDVLITLVRSWFYHVELG